jgi:thioredoxin 1
VIDCWASWCKAFSRDNLLLNNLSQEFAGRIKVCRLNVATADEIASSYNIRAVPTLLIFSDGKIVDRSIGTPQLDPTIDRLNLLIRTVQSTRELVSCQ